MQNEERIRRRAHEIWQREGQPEGRDQDHWEQACREIAAEAAPDEAPTPTAPDGGATPAEAASAAQAVSGAPAAGKATPRPRRAAGSARKGSSA